MARCGIGLPANNRTPYKTEEIGGMRIRTHMKLWAGAHAGWNVWIDGLKYYTNVLTRDEAIGNCVNKYRNGKPTAK